VLSLSLRSAVLIFRASVSILCLCASVLNPITLCLWISVSRERRPPTLPYLLLCITYLLITYLLKFTTANYIFTKVYFSITYLLKFTTANYIFTKVYFSITYLLKFTTANYIFTKVYLSISCSVLLFAKVFTAVSRERRPPTSRVYRGKREPVT
jgi:hypothetical protein